MKKVATSREARPHIAALRNLYRSGQLIPFVGAGISRGLGLPDWRELTSIIGSELGYGVEEFLDQGSFPQLVEYSQLVSGSIEPIRETLRRVLQSEEAVGRRRQSEVFAILASGNYPRIYTTNVDDHIEAAFEEAGHEVSVIRNISDLQRAKRGTEVIKFHGTLEDAASLVLTETAYLRRMRLEDPLDLLLRADSLRSAFLFIGYSFSDANIRFIWNALAELRRESFPEGGPAEGLNSALLGLGLNEVQLALLANWGIDVIQLDASQPEADLAGILSKIMA